MITVCAASVLQGAEAFSTLGEVRVVPDAAIDAASVRDADALVIRSKTRVDAALLRDSRLRFVGTATAGTDHLDTALLAEAGIACCAAPGCNADAVAEYVTAALLDLAQRCGEMLAGRTLGVVGVGQVGRRVLRHAAALGMNVLANDPPRHLAEGDPSLLPLDEILPQCDAITLHTPFTVDGPFPTAHLANHAFFERLKPGCLFINASRGEVADSAALLHAIDHGVVRRCALDVFEGEPKPDLRVVAAADLATPHIAGYSYDGRLKGTLMVYQALCHFLETTPLWTPEPLLPTHRHIPLDERGHDPEELIRQAVGAAYAIRRDDAEFRAGLAGDDSARGTHFNRLRKEYPVRHEFPAYTISAGALSPNTRSALAALGFAIT